MHLTVIAALLWRGSVLARVLLYRTIISIISPHPSVDDNLPANIILYHNIYLFLHYSRIGFYSYGELFFLSSGGRVRGNSRIVGLCLSHSPWRTLLSPPCRHTTRAKKLCTRVVIITISSYRFTAKGCNLSDSIVSRAALRRRYRKLQQTILL